MIHLYHGRNGGLDQVMSGCVVSHYFSFACFRGQETDQVFLLSFEQCSHYTVGSLSFYLLLWPRHQYFFRFADWDNRRIRHCCLRKMFYLLSYVVAHFLDPEQIQFQLYCGVSIACLSVISNVAHRDM